LVLVNGHIADASRASVPACHAWHGRNVVAVSGHRRQTGRLVTGRFPGCVMPGAPDSSIWCSAVRLLNRTARPGRWAPVHTASLPTVQRDPAGPTAYWWGASPPFHAEVVGDPLSQPLRGGGVKAAPGRQLKIGKRHATHTAGRPDTTTTRAANEGKAVLPRRHGGPGTAHTTRRRRGCPPTGPGHG
jgi:hypothetical protein